MNEADGGYTLNPQERQVKPRRGLPNGRAVAGALLVTIAAVGAYAVASSGGGTPAESYLVMSRSVAAGSPLGPGDVSAAPMDIPAAAAANSLQSLSQMEGATAVHALAAGDLLSRHDLIAAPQAGGEALGAIHELALAVEHHRIPRGTSNGDRVTVLTTLADDAGAPLTVVAVEDAVVLGWTSGDALAGSGVLTLAIDDAHTAATVAHLVAQGETTVITTTRAIGDEYPAQVRGIVSPAGASEGATEGDAR